MPSTTPLLLLAPAPSLGLSGVTSYLDALGPRLARCGIGCMLLLVRPGPENRVVQTGLGRLRRVQVTYNAPKDLIGLVARVPGVSHASIVHAHDDSLLPLAAEIARRNRARLVHTVHYVHEGTASWIDRFAPTVIAISTSIADQLGGVGQVIPHFADTRWFAKPNLFGRGQLARLRAGVGAQEQVLLFAGRSNSPDKGADLLVAAADLLWRKGHAFRLVFAGPFWLPPVPTSVLAPYSARVTILGTLSRPALFAWYRSSNVLVVPSRYEPFGLVALEAQTVGTPVVASAVGGLADVVHPSIGRRVPMDSGQVRPDALAAAIVSVLRQPDHRAELASWTARTFSEGQHIARLARLYGLELDPSRSSDD